MKKNFEDILKKLSPTLRRITHKLNGHFTFFDEDDLFQEALEHLWLSYKNNSLADKTDSYVLQSCYFHLKNYLRVTLDKAKLVSLQKVAEDGDSALEAFLGYEDRGIADNIEEASILRGDSVRGMDTREKQVLKLSMEGFTVREIARKIGVSHVMVVKIRKNMRKHFNRDIEIGEHGYQN